jgi:aldehyde:ferredoxin oxidoreductase
MLSWNLTHGGEKMNCRILKIDLTSRSHEMEEIPAEILRKYLGGRGLGAYLLYKNVPANADPLGEENHLIFTAGPASGTSLFYSSKANLATKSPLTGIYLHSISSGTLAAQMRKAGLWAIDIRGVSDRPVYLSIEGTEVRYCDGTRLSRMEPALAQKALLAARSGGEAATVAIGPAGEELHPMAAVFCEGPVYRCFGRGGAGAVMGSKKLKGLVVSGKGDVRAADENGLESVKREIGELLRTNLKMWAEIWRRYETGADLETLNELGILPARNWQTGQFEGWRKINKSTTPLGWPETGRPCGPYCPTPGCREVEVKAGPYQGARSDLEYEALYSFGTACGIDKMEAVIAASQICDEHGVDTLSAGLTLAFVMECFEKKRITKKEMDGLELRFGNDQSMIAALKKLVRQEGFGKELARGTRYLSWKIPGTEDFAIQVKGLELGGYECRGLNGQALQFSVASRGGCHHSFGLPARREVMDNSRLDVEGKGNYVKNTAIGQIMRDSLIVCSFCPAFSDPIIAKTLTALFGEPWTIEDFREAGIRVMCQERLFNAREGITRKDDTLPGRLLKEPRTEGPTKGMVVPLEQLKDRFYEAMGYDLQTGNPTDGLLTRLGIEK